MKDECIMHSVQQPTGDVNANYRSQTRRALRLITWGDIKARCLIEPRCMSSATSPLDSQFLALTVNTE